MNLEPFTTSLDLGLLRRPEDLCDLVDLCDQLLCDCDIIRTLGTGGTCELGRFVEERVQLRVCLKVIWLEVVGPKNPEVLLDLV